jgi:hypothetical protein
LRATVRSDERNTLRASCWVSVLAPRRSRSPAIHCRKADRYFADVEAGVLEESLVLVEKQADQEALRHRIETRQVRGAETGDPCARALGRTIAELAAQALDRRASLEDREGSSADGQAQQNADGGERDGEPRASRHGRASSSSRCVSAQ